jgi:hypothetical protein
MTFEKKLNPWIVHCKKYQEEHKCSYKTAIKDAKASYVPVKRGKETSYTN